jgi:hypothetical protein
MEEPTHDHDHITATSPAMHRRWARAAAGFTAAGVLLLGGATAAFAAAPGGTRHLGYSPAIKSRHHGLTRVINDWEVGVPGFPRCWMYHLASGAPPS